MTTHDPYAEIKDLVEVTYQNAPNRPLNYHPENGPIFVERGTFYWEIPLPEDLHYSGLTSNELYPVVDDNELFTPDEFDNLFNQWPDDSDIRRQLVDNWETDEDEPIVPYFDFLLEHHHEEFSKLMDDLPELMWDAWETATDGDFPPFVDIKCQDEVRRRRSRHHPQRTPSGDHITDTPPNPSLNPSVTPIVQPTQLPQGDWGIRAVNVVLYNGQPVTVVTRHGKRWPAIVEQVISSHRNEQGQLVMNATTRRENDEERTKRKDAA